MNNFKKGSVIVFTLLLLVLMCQSVGYSAQISRSVIYDATIEPFGKIDKEIVFPENHDPFYLHVSFLLSPGTITADLSGAVIFDQNNGTIMLRGSRGNLSTDGGINFKGSIEMDFVIPVNFYTLLFASPGLVLVDLVFDLPDEVPVDGTVTVFDLGPHWRDSESFNSFLLNGESVKVTAGVRDILSKKLSAVDLAGIIVTSMTGIPPIVVDVAEDVIKIGLGDSRISLNAGLTSNLTLSGEAIIVNGQRVVREGQSIAAPGLDRSRNSYEVNTTYVENFTTVLDLLFSADIELIFNPLGIEMWEYDEPIAELPINVVPERTRELEFRTTPETIVFPIEQTSANRSPQPEGSINIRPLTVGGSAARGDVSPYFSDPDNDRLTYRAQSDNTSVATVSVSGSEVTITPRSEGSTDITITATDPAGLTARQTVTVTVQADHGCEYTLSESSQDVLADGGSLDVYVTTTSGCDWRATTNSDFLSVRPSRGTGSGTVTVTVAANTRTRSRTGRLTIAGETFTVRQDGVRTIASQELSRGDAVIVQNTLHRGLNIRSGASTDHPKIGGVLDGATGTVVDGPRRANGYKWWKVDWDNAPTGWSVEAIDENLLILRRPPDLAIESFDVSENRLDPGEEFTLSLTVRNVGYNSSEETDLYYYHTSAPALTSTADLTMVGTDTVRGLSPNGTSDESIRVKAPLTPGTYYYAAVLINDGSDPNIVNNLVPSKERVTVRRPTFPDLVVSFSVNEDTLAPRERFTLSATVQNRGAGASRSTKLRYYRSSDSTISTDDTQVETDGVNSLDPDDTDDESAIINAPNQAGVYYYGACVDSVRNERDTDNNCSNGVRVTISGSSGSPDLVVENVQVSNNILTIGASFRVSATVRNRRADPSDSTRLRYYRSDDSTISTDDTEVGTDGVGSISGDGTRDESETLTAPSEAGTYYYGACVDSVRGESKTGNNCSDGIPVVVRALLNQAPEAVGTVPPQILTEGRSAANVGVSHNFDDPDNDSLTYTATSDNTSVATVSVSDALVTITPQNAGRATITVTASDGTLTATQDITVTVDAAPRTVQTLVKISGDNQQGVPGATLTSPFVVKVWDAAGNPLGGIIVTFAVTAGGGSLSAQTATTNANGQASTTLTLGPNAGTNTVEASVTGISASVSFTAIAQARVGEVVNIPDTNLRAAIEKALGKGSGVPITVVEMATLTRFSAENSGISDLTGLESATNLTYLSLVGNSISDISTLAELTKLTELWLSRNSISDISAVAGLTKLTWLILWGNSISDISALVGLTNLTYLSLDGNSISDITSVTGLTNLTTLSFGGNSVSNIAPVSDLTKLTELVLTNNSISDISAVAGLTNLTELRLNENSISDISAVAGLTKLTTLRLDNNSISDISPLVANTGLGSGDRVFVRGNPLSYLSIHTHIPTLQGRGVTVNFDNRIPTTLLKISGDNQQGAPGATLVNLFIVEVQDANDNPFEGVPVTFAVTAGGGSLSTQTATTNASGQASTMLTLGPNPGTNTVEASVTGISASVRFTAIAQVQVGDVGDIPDPNLRAAIEKALGKASGAPITPAEMATLTRLEAQQAGISDLTGLESATNLTDLFLKGNSISDISPLSGLTQLTGLGLNGNDVTDISLLSGLTQLTLLTLGANNITDAAPVAGLTNLTALSLYGNDITDISVLSGLTNLTRLYLRDNNITDISPLSGLTQLTLLTLDNNDITDISPLVVNTGLGSGDTVNVRGNPLSSVSIQTHIPTLQSRGVTVEFDDVVVGEPGDIPDPNLPRCH